MSKAKPWYAGAFPRMFDKHEPPTVTDKETKLPSKEWKKKYKCKKNKGDHDWAVFSIHNSLEYTVKTSYGIAHGSYHPRHNLPPEIPLHTMTVRSRVEWRCRKCNKHESEWLSEDTKNSLFGGMFTRYNKKLNPFRHVHN